MENLMTQIVPSAGYTPPCDYSTFAENFDLSLLPGGEQPLSPSTQFYAQSPTSLYEGKQNDIKIYTTCHFDSPKRNFDDKLELELEFHKLLQPASDQKSLSVSDHIYLEVPSPNDYRNSPMHSPIDGYLNYRQSTEYNFYSSPEHSVHTSSPRSTYSSSPCGDYSPNHLIKEENQYASSPLLSISPLHLKEEYILTPCSFPSSLSPASGADQTDLNVYIKEEKDLPNFKEAALEENAQNSLNGGDNKDHQLLRQVLKDTSFQKKYNVKPFDLKLLNNDIKIEESEKMDDSERMETCSEQLSSENIEPVLNLAIEEVRKEVDDTCSALGISPDPSQWTESNVLSWLRWTARQFNLPECEGDKWNLTGPNLISMTEEDFIQKAPQGGMILHARLEIWKAAYSDINLKTEWMQQPSSSNASSGTVSEDEEEDVAMQTGKSSTMRTGGSHIHLWQFLKELLMSPQTHGSCIRWLDRSKGIFKIEDSVKVAKLWGKRKNRPAMNYDKLSRSIRQYYKKGIMKKTERSQRLVYQFCHPYSL